jgi:hypothetical protein
MINWNYGMVFLLRGAIKPEKKGAVREEEGATIAAISHDDGAEELSDVFVDFDDQE